MTRDSLRALGISDEQVEQIMKLHGQSTQALQAAITQGAAEITRLKGVETEYEKLKAQPPVDPLIIKDIPENPELQKALDRVASLESEMRKKDIAVYASSKGLTGEQAKSILDALGDNVELANKAIDSISQIISDTDKTARDDEKKALLNGTPNPDGGIAAKTDDKPEDVKNAESITFGETAADAATRDYYVLK